MAFEVGIVFDSQTFGIEIDEEVQRLAQDSGWQGEFAYCDDDHVTASADEAVKWLNKNLAEKEHHFGWSDGCFVYLPNDHDGWNTLVFSDFG